MRKNMCPAVRMAIDNCYSVHIPVSSDSLISVVKLDIHNVVVVAEYNSKHESVL